MLVYQRWLCWNFYWTICDFTYRFLFLQHHHPSKIPYPSCTKSQKAMWGYIGEEVHFWKQLPSQVLNIQLFSSVYISAKVCLVFFILIFIGFHLKMPFLTQYEPVQVTLQTDQVTWLEKVQDGNFSSFGSILLKFEIMVSIAGDWYTLRY